MSIEPETKDWTWVLSRACAECGENVGELDVAGCVAKLRALAPQWVEALEGGSGDGAGDGPGPADLTQRPDSRTWSALEYAAHVRDALAVFAQRIELMLVEDSPTFADWDQDAAAVAGKYNEENPARVTAEVENAINASAEMLERLDPATHEREGLRSDGAPFTVTTLSQYFVHDVAHHLVDVKRQ